MNLSELRLLLDYHYWARDRALDAASALTQEQFTRDLSSSFRSVRDTLVHAYGAESAWYQRWQGTSPSSLPAADQFPDVASLRNAWTALEEKMRAFLDKVGDAGLDRVYEFKTLAGQSASGILWQMLQHVANHASYHRGQVTTMLRQLGAAPPKSMDMVTFYREHSVVSRD